MVIFSVGFSFWFLGKLAVITGSNEGVGFETARTLAALGANVVLACRNVQKAEEAAKSIGSKASTMPLNLACFQDIRVFAQGCDTTTQVIYLPRVHQEVRTLRHFHCQRWRWDNSSEIYKRWVGIVVLAILTFSKI